MARIKIEDIKAEIEKSGWKIISEKYVNLEEELEFLCDEGHSVFLPWKKARQLLECPICKNNQYKNQNSKIIPKKKGEFRVLALDQATYISGYSIFSNKQLIKYGTFKTKLDDEIARVSKIKEWLISMVQNWQPDLVVLEGIQYQQQFGVTVFETLARLQGVLMETLYELKIPYKIAPTNTWRSYCGVKGRTRVDKKRSMQFLVKQWFDVNADEDCSDAIGIGKYGAETVITPPKIKIAEW